MLFRRSSRPEDRKPVSIREYAATIEAILTESNVDLNRARLDVQGGYGWRFQRGSAVVQVYLIENEDRSYFQVFSPIMHLPTTGLLSLYRRLLEMNLKMTSASIGIHNDVVYVFNERAIDGLDAEEANAIISLVSGYADDLDNKLISEFGGRLYQQPQ